MSLESWWLEPLKGDADGPRLAASLSSAEARKLLAQFGPNLFREKETKSLLLQYPSRFKIRRFRSSSSPVQLLRLACGT